MPVRDFAVDPVILATTHHVADWPLSRLFLQDDGRYFWCLLVPRREGVIEVADLAPEDQAQLMQEIVRLSNGLRVAEGVEKLNVGALGNMVPQLHVHVIGRRKGDPAWPGPVWGHSPVVRHAPAELDRRLALVRSF